MLNWFLSMIASWLMSLFSGMGGTGIVVLIAGVLLLSSLTGAVKKFFGTPKGRLVLAGVLVAALAFMWFAPHAGLRMLRNRLPSDMLAKKNKAAADKTAGTAGNGAAGESGFMGMPAGTGEMLVPLPGGRGAP